MNYRHAFHAGNFADLLKHAVLADLIGRLVASPAPLTVIDTHAGAGIYDLVGSEAKRSGEADAGIGRLLAAADPPPVFMPLIALVRRLSTDGRLYPGSPLIAARTLRVSDAYIGHELRPDDFAALKAALKDYRHARAVKGDGYAAAPGLVQPSARTLVLIDPPFERPDDYRRIAETVSAVLRRNAKAAIAVWLPIKDLDTLDGFRTRMENAGAPGFLAETRIRPLDDPMKMNGCAMLALNPPDGAEAAAREAAEWIAASLGAPGAKAVVSAL